MLLFILCLVRVLGLLGRKFLGQSGMALLKKKSIKNKAQFFHFCGLQEQENSRQGTAGISSILSAVFSFSIFSFSSSSLSTGSDVKLIMPNKLKNTLGLT